MIKEYDETGVSIDGEEETEFAIVGQNICGNVFYNNTFVLFSLFLKLDNYYII